MSAVPTGSFTGMFTFPSLSVVPVTFVPFGSVTVIGAFPIALLFSSVNVMSRLVFVLVPLFAIAVICVGIFGMVICVVVLAGFYVSFPGCDTVIS